jgi:hypothetical protein
MIVGGDNGIELVGDDNRIKVVGDDTNHGNKLGRFFHINQTRSYLWAGSFFLR